MRIGKLVLGALAAIGVGKIVFGSKKSRAAGVAAPPDNLTFVEGKLDALQLGGSITMNAGPFIIVAADEAHYKVAAKIAAERARKNPQFEYVLIPMDLARELAAERGQQYPPDAWGGVVSIVDGAVITHELFGVDVDAAAATQIVLTVEGTVPGLEGLGQSQLPPVSAGFVPPELPPATE